MPVVLTNNAVSRLASSLTAVATSLSVTAGEGAKFPSPPAGSWFPVTLIKASGSLEIVRCTARSGDVLTIARSQEGTGAQAFSPGDRVELRVTAAALAEFKQTVTISNYMNGMLDDPDAATARATLELANAALATVQTSTTDKTVGALLAVGAFGIGADTPPIPDIDAVGYNGLFRVVADNPKNPFFGLGSMGFNFQSGSSSGWQILGAGGGALDLRARIKNSGTWAAWFPIYTDNKFSSTVKTLLAATNEATARAAIGAISTSNFPGVLDANGYISIAGGFQLAYGSVAVSSDQAASVTFQTAFPSACVGVIPIMSSNVVSGNGERNPITYGYSRTGATIRMGNAIAGNVFYLAVGY